MILSKNLNNIKVVMERNLILRKIVKVLRYLGVIHVLHILSDLIDKKSKNKEYLAFIEYYETHKYDYEKTKTILEEESRELYELIIKRLRGGKLLPYRCISYPQYFVKNLFKLSTDVVFVDGGAYIGDSINDFKLFTKGKWKSIYAWEPDAINRELLLKRVCKEKNIKVIDKGLWCRKEILNFNSAGTDKSSICDDGICIEVDTIDNICGEEKIGMIKMDIEGSEQEALHGAKKVIKRDKPVLAICIYHSYEDFWKIPQIIKEIEPSYKIYVRAHSDEAAEIVVYAIAK